MRGRRFEALDSLRGICASFIVLFHLNTNGFISNAPLIKNGSLFVDFFFVLSGFVISASYRDRVAQGFPIRRFMALRIARVWPLHLVMLVAFLLFELLLASHRIGASDRVAFTGAFDLRWLVASVLLVQPFVGPDQTPWNGPSWSIAVEVWTYLIFAGLYRWARPWLIPVSVIIAMAACLYLGNLTDRYLAVYHDGALARCLYGFAGGTVAYALVERWPERARLHGWTATMLEVVAVALIILLVRKAGATRLSLVMPVLFAAVVTIFAQEGGSISRLLRLGPMLFLGTLSYSIYMVHGFLMYRLVNILSLIDRVSDHRFGLVERNATGGYHVAGSTLFGDVMSLVLLMLTIAVSYVTYRLVERPAQDAARRYILGATSKPAARRAEAEATQAGF